MKYHKNVKDVYINLKTENEKILRFLFIGNKQIPV